MLKAIVITALVAAFVLFAAMVAMLVFYSSEKTEADDYDQPAITKNDNAENRRSAADETTSDRKQQAASKREWYDTFVTRPTEWLLVLFNGLLVLATIALFVSGERNVEVARRAANAAQKSAEIAEKTLIASQRPIVTVKEFNTRSKSDGQGITHWVIETIMENSGETPGTSVLSHINFLVGPSDLPKDYAFPDLAPTEMKFSVIGPKQIRAFGELPVPVQSWARVASGAHKAFVYGWIEYEGLLDEAHRTEFAVQVTVEGNPDRPDFRISFPMIGGYNCVDKNCKYKTYKDVPINPQPMGPGTNLR